MPKHVSIKTRSRLEIIQAIEKSRGNLSEAAKRLGVSRPTLYKNVRHDPEILSVLRDRRERMIDEAETVLRRELRAGNLKAAQFVLRFLVPRFLPTVSEQIESVTR